MGWQALQGGGSAGVAGGGGSGSAVGSGSSSKQKLMSMFGRRASQSNVEAQREEVTCSVQRVTCNIGCESIDVAKRTGQRTLMPLPRRRNGYIIARREPGTAVPHLHRD
jgi:hypothetical protein